MNAPLFCVAGTLCDSRVFTPTLSACGAITAVCAVVEHSLVEAAAAAMLQTAPDRFVAVGFSLGGFVAIEMARRAPDRVLGLCLIGSNARPDLPDNAASRRAQLGRFETTGGAVAIAEIWPNCVSPHHADREDVRAALVAMADSTPYGRFAAQTELAITRPSARQTLAELTKPVLALHGRDDAICPPDRAAEIAAATPLGSLEMIEGAGHFVLLEQPDAVADALMAWSAREGLG